MADAEARLGVDVGGTFTDLVLIAGDRLVTAKVPSTPDDQSEGVMRSLEAAEVTEAAAFAHGMTVATNALLERRGARTALVTTEGFRDVIEIGRQDRAALYDLTAGRPPALVPRELRFTVRERMGPDGELEPLDEESVAAAVEAIGEAEVEAVAVCLLFGFLHPEHEQAVGEALREALGDVHVSLSSEVLPEFREYERTSTTVADAYLGPRLGAYLEQLAGRAEEAGLPAPLVMQSSGGVVEVAAAAEQAASCVLSGPAGGVVGAAYAAQASGFEDVLTFDMGGTSTDVAPIVGGEAQTTTESVVAGVPIKLPMVDVHTVSAGGGSLAWADAGGALRVGPESAGADPGPAAYGRGGEEPTVTDANLFLGYLGDGAELGGEVTLSRERAEAALDRVGGRLDLDAEATALGIVRVANAEMTRALRVISVQRGLDPRDFALVAFGGAGGMHACALAEELGMQTVIVPRAAGVLSALGLAISDVRQRPRAPAARRAGRGGDGGGLHSAGGRGRRARAAPPRRCALSPPVLRADDRRRRPGRAGRGLPHRPRAALRLSHGGGAARARQRPPGGDDPGRQAAARGRAGRRGRRRADAPGVLRRRLERGAGARARVARPRRHGRGARGGRAGRGDLRRAARLAGEGRRRRRAGARAMSLDPVTLSVLASALAGIAEEMGAVLIRGAYSSNIKERRDCSAALFDAEGRLVAQAEHIPVHLGAMPESVAAVIEREPAPGDVFVLNDPFAGGTHLPDITLVSPVALDGDVVGYAVTRAHHSDVGGMSPGSMPSGSRELLQEGLVIPPLRLEREGEVVQDVLDLILANVRTPDVRRGDLRAQLAANRLAERRVAELVERRGREIVLDAFGEVLAYAERRTREAIGELPDGRYEARGEMEGDGVSDDDVEICVTVTVDGEELVIDFDGTADAVAGNVNCPLAVTRSACYFALRVLLPGDVPANAGAYAPLEVRAPEGSLVHAVAPSAVVAGNVETSQRIADTVLLALAEAVELPAQGQGTMNNLIIGGRGWTYYETIAGGQGASAERDGPSGVHVGMTNTLNTPVEALELEYPMRVERYELRYGSGGDGEHRGGDGIVRAVRVLEPATLSLLTDRRRHQPQGAAGGEPGEVGANRLDDEELPPKVTRGLDTDAVVTVETPGGGGYGEAE